jgi:hypothetical protein
MVRPSVVHAYPTPQRDLPKRGLQRQKPARRPLPPHLAREDLRHPAPCSCPSRGGALRKIADEISETLDYVPSRFKVVRHKLSLHAARSRRRLHFGKCACKRRGGSPRHARPSSGETQTKEKSGTGLLQTRRWSEMDSNFQFRANREHLASSEMSPIARRQCHPSSCEPS